MNDIDLSIYLVTDSDMMRTAGHHAVDAVRRAVDGGVTTVQVRDKHADAGATLAYLEALGQALPPSIPVLVNDRIDVYLAARNRGIPVAGVHIGQCDLPARETRAMIGPDAVLGLSAATREELEAAHRSPAAVDYVGIAAVRSTDSKPDHPDALGVEGVIERAGTCPLPAVAIGGVLPDDLPALRTGGLAGAAVVSWICAADDPHTSARVLADAWEAGA